MVPTFSDFFKSFYVSNTYLPPVDLSEKGISGHLLESEDQDASQRAQELISQPEVQAILSEPLICDHTKVQENNRLLERCGFKLVRDSAIFDLGVLRKIIFRINPRNRDLEDCLPKIPLYDSFEHEDLEGWVIKPGTMFASENAFLYGLTKDKSFIEDENILAIEMAKRVAKAAKDADIEVVLPKMKLVAYHPSEGVTEASKKYCLVCEKIEVLSVEDTFKTIRAMTEKDQKGVARKISTIVRKAGLAGASFDNIRLTSDGKLAFIDTKPAGLMVAKKPGIWNKLFGAKGDSVEKCAKIGLFNLIYEISKDTPGTGDTTKIESCLPVIPAGTSGGQVPNAEINPAGDAQSTQSSVLVGDDQNINKNSTNDVDSINLQSATYIPAGIATCLPEFHKQLVEDYENVAIRKLSKWKIALSVVSLGLIPLINAITALVLTKLTQRTYQNFQENRRNYKRELHKYRQEKVPDLCKHYETNEEFISALPRLLQVLQDSENEKFVKDFVEQDAITRKRLFFLLKGL